MHPSETNFFEVAIHDTDQIAFLRWKRAVTLQEYQVGMKAFIRLLEENEVKKSLIDSSQRGALNAESDEWIFNALKSEVVNTQLQDHQLALVMTEERYQQLIQNYSLLQAGNPELPFNINYFTKMEEAVHWLVNDN